MTGYPHGNDDGKILMSAESMSAKVLCQSHNSKLSNVSPLSRRTLGFDTPREFVAAG